ncbi:MAG: hypothetical protein KC493_16990 [Bacteriovoracaceae bacterium]|nr:hypothetical protein [Bacteriovoracaceae bacterium]
MTVSTEESLQAISALPNPIEKKKALVLLERASGEDLQSLKKKLKKVENLSSTSFDPLTSVFIHNGVYSKPVMKGKVPSSVSIASFKLVAKSIIKINQHEIVRVDLVSQTNKVYADLVFQPDVWNSLKAFKTRVGSFGEAMFKGTDKDIQEIKFLLFTDPGVCHLKGVTTKGIHPFDGAYCFVSDDLSVDSRGNDVSSDIIYVKGGNYEA